MDGPLITTTRTKVVVDRGLYALLLDRGQKWRRLSYELRRRLIEEHGLLLAALHELALAKGKEPQHFSQRWLSDKRREPDPVPLTVITREGGEARVERS